MADITVSMTLRYAKNKASASLSGGFGASQAGDKYEAGVQSIGTTEESLQKGDVGTIGWLAIRNMDATNYVEFGSTTGVYSITLLPGEAVCTRWNHTGVFSKANTAAVEVEYLAIEL